MSRKPKQQLLDVVVVIGMVDIADDGTRYATSTVIRGDLNERDYDKMLRTIGRLCVWSEMTRADETTWRKVE
jgi:hypothetical protein